MKNPTRAPATSTFPAFDPGKVKNLDTEALDRLIERHRSMERTGDPAYRVALAERERRGVLKFEATLAAIHDAAAQDRCISYTDIAHASGADFAKVRFKMNRHLDNVLEFAHHAEWPLITAVIVNARGVQTGDFDEAALTGFVEAARRLGVSVSDPSAFARQQQALTFAWAKQPLVLPP